MMYDSYHEMSIDTHLVRTTCVNIFTKSFNYYNSINLPVTPNSSSFSKIYPKSVVVDCKSVGYVPPSDKEPVEKLK